MVSKELLSEVLGEDYEILKIGKHFVRIRHVEAYRYTEWCEHKVAHMCKEWAARQHIYSCLPQETGFTEITTTVCEDGKCSCYIGLTGDFNNIDGSKYDSLTGYVSCINNIDADTEPEAVFKACQWILENKEN